MTTASPQPSQPLDDTSIPAAASRGGLQKAGTMSTEHLTSEPDTRLNQFAESIQRAEELAEQLLEVPQPEWASAAVVPVAPTETAARPVPQTKPEPLPITKRGNPVRRALQFAEPITPQALLLAWKRRWKQAVLLGLPFGAVMATVIWSVMPAPFTAFALLHIAAVEPRLVFQTAEGESDFHTYRKTQVALIKSRFVLNAALRRPGISELSLVRQKPYPVQWLENDLTVDSYDSPEIVRLSLSGDEPEQLTALVNAVKDAYLEEVVLADRKKRLSRLADLERIFEETDQKVRQREQRIESLAKQLGTGDAKALSFKHQMAMEQFQLLKRELSSIRFAITQEQAKGTSTPFDPATATSANGFGSPSALLLEDPRQPASPEKRIAQLRLLIAKYEQQVVDPQNNPTLKAYRDELAQLQGMVPAPVAPAGKPGSTTTASKPMTKLDYLRKQETLLGEELDKYAEMVKNIGTSSYELELMKSEKEQVAKIAERVSSEAEAMRIELQSPTRVTLMQEADVPRTRDMGKKQKLSVAGGIGSMGMIFLLIAVLEFHSRRITDPKDVSQTLGLDLLGTLPAMPRPMIQFWKQPKGSRVALWNNALIESIDSVRSILLHAPDTDRRHVLMVASAAAGEGKTTFACQLAGSLARAGRKVVLVDFDLRRPRAHDLLHVPLEPGLCELLTGTKTLDDVLHRTDGGRLHVIPAGRVTEPALQSLARDGADWLFQQLKQDYEFVIVDSSPILYVADGGSIGRHVDGAIVVVRSHLSRIPAVAVACERIEKLGIELLGAVMVGVRSTLSGYGYSYDYHYGAADVTS